MKNPIRCIKTRLKEVGVINQTVNYCVAYKEDANELIPAKGQDTMRNLKKAIIRP